MSGLAEIADGNSKPALPSIFQFSAPVYAFLVEDGNDPVLERGSDGKGIDDSAGGGTDFGICARLAAAQHPSLEVCVRNDAHVADDTLEEAGRVVSKIYSQAGLTLIWCADNCGIMTALRSRVSHDTARRAKDAMGYTPGGGEERGRLAFVLVNRVNKIADGYSTARSIVLGAAIAHELGHLLISKQHTKTGIMKSYLNQSDFRKVGRGELSLIGSNRSSKRSRAGRRPGSIGAGAPARAICRTR